MILIYVLYNIYYTIFAAPATRTRGGKSEGKGDGVMNGGAGNRRKGRAAVPIYIICIICIICITCIICILCIICIIFILYHVCAGLDTNLIHVAIVLELLALVLRWSVPW